MSIVATDLRDSIIDGITGLSNNSKVDPLSVHSVWASEIESYLKENLIALGDYTGVTSGGNPDPLTGTDYEWKFGTLEVSGSALYTGGQSGFESWVGAIELAIQGTTFKGTDESGNITVSAPLVLSMFSLSLKQSDITGSSFEGIIGIIADKIVTFLLETGISSVTTDATSSSGGSGTVTFTELI